MGSSGQLMVVEYFDLHARVVNPRERDSDDLENVLFSLLTSVWNFSVAVGEPSEAYRTSFSYVPQHKLTRKNATATRMLNVYLVSTDDQYQDYLIDLKYPNQISIHSSPWDHISVDTYLSVQNSLNCTKTAFRLSNDNQTERQSSPQSSGDRGGQPRNKTQPHELRDVLESIDADTGEVILSLDPETGAVHHHPSGQTVEAQFVELLEDDVVLVCVEQLYQATSFSPAPLVLQRFFSSRLIYVSVGCQTLSVVCLFLVLLTYCLFEELRTLPGKNTVGLVSSLLATMLLFEVGVARVENPTLCTVLGVLIHFCLLSSFTWMVICSVSMHRVFTHVLHARRGQLIGDSALFPRYVVLSLVVPAGIVAVTLMGNWLAEVEDCLGLDLGYGRGICYVSNVWSQVLGTLVPVCVAVGINLVLFLFTVRSLWSVSDQVKSATRQHRMQLAVYVRMASLTGINWMVGMVTAVIDSVVVWYIFIVLCGLQGLYIFLAFVCNRRVLSLYRALLCGKQKEERTNSQTQQEVFVTTEG